MTPDPPFRVQFINTKDAGWQDYGPPDPHRPRTIRLARFVHYSGWGPLPTCTRVIDANGTTLWQRDGTTPPRD